ncbi:MAG: histone deacetylase [Nanoarchaeota archaeon]|nr:histone deacetylase [Nanoarchaeota archaeon]
MKLISHTIFLKHDMHGHPERADRIRQALKVFPYENAKDGEAYLTKVHTQRYIQKVKEASALAASHARYLDAGETYVCKDTYKAACYAVGAAVQAAEYALKKQPAFALVRPPGHHAHPDWTNGFCIFNNMAVAAVHLAEKKEKVLIIDIDLHRGDGTADCVSLYNSRLGDRLFYFSINQYGVFPGMAIDEGNIKNIYVEAGLKEDQYISILKKELPPLIHRFKPTVIGISAGFDSFAKDKETHASELGCGLSLTKRAIAELKGIIKGLPYFAVLEGGYNHESVVEGVAAFLGVAVKEEKKPEQAVKKKQLKSAVKKKATPEKKHIAKKPSAKKKQKRVAATRAKRAKSGSKKATKAKKPAKPKKAAKKSKKR